MDIDSRIRISYNIIPKELLYDSNIDLETFDLGPYTHIDLQEQKNVDVLLEKISRNKSFMFLHEINLSNTDVSFEGLNQLKNIQTNNYFIREKVYISGRFGCQAIQLKIVLYGTTITKNNGDNRWMLNNNVRYPSKNKIKVLYLDDEEREINEAYLILNPIY